MSGPLKTSWAISGKQGRLLWLAVLIIAAATFASYHAWRNRCVSRDPGLRGEVMQGADGKYLYFDGECWSARPVTPTDTGI